jgi:hypothetical protein
MIAIDTNVLNIRVYGIENLAPNKKRGLNHVTNYRSAD